MEGEPLISVVVVAERAQDTIGGTLKSIFEANHGNKEVIVVVNDPDDPSVQVARDFPVKIYNSQEDGPRLFGEGGRGFGYQRDLAWRVAEGEFIAYCDSDKLIERGWFNKMLKPFRNPKVGGVRNVEQAEGNSIIVKLKTGTSWAQYYSLRLLSRFPGIRLTFQANMWRRETLEDVGGFDRGMARAIWDMDISYRAWKRGWRLSTTDAISYHHEHLSLGSKIEEKWRPESKLTRRLFYQKHNTKPSPVLSLGILTLGILATPMILWRTRSLVSLLWPFYFIAAKLFGLWGYLSQGGGMNGER